MADLTREMQVGDGLFVMMLEISDLKEADINAQVMQPAHFERLTENIRARGQLEQLPYVHWPERTGPKHIVSGHHRARAARAAGLTEIPCLVDTWAMTRSQRTSKQVSHNELHGSPDEAILAQLVAIIDNVDDLLATGLPENWMPTVEGSEQSLGIPAADFTYHTVTLLFLTRQLDDIKAALDSVDPAAEIVGLADAAQFEDFAQRVIDFGRSKNIRSVAACIAVLAAIARREAAEARAKK